MITVVIMTILGALFALFVPENVFENRRTTLTILSMIGLFIGSALGLVLDQLVGNKYWVQTDRRSIVSMSDGQTVEGNFFVGSGHIDGHEYYHYYAKMPNGSIRKGRRSCDLSEVFEHNGKHAYVIEYRSYNNSPFVIHKYRRKYEFHVPKNSVKRQFNLDLE